MTPRFVAMMIQAVLFLLCCWKFALGASVTGKFDITPRNLTVHDIARTSFKLFQIGNYSTERPYHARTKLINTDGGFVFDNLPLNKGVNSTTHFVMHSDSLDYNLKPNRILLEFIALDTDANQYNLTAYKNFFGKEYFPSKDIVYPEKLEVISSDPFLQVTFVNKAPLRFYYQDRNASILQGGFIGSILASRWKTAGVVTIFFLMMFPLIIEKLDPETTKVIKDEAQRKQREKYQTHKNNIQ